MSTSGKDAAAWRQAKPLSSSVAEWPDSLASNCAVCRAITGRSSTSTATKRAPFARAATARLLDTAVLFEADGLAIDIVTGAGTGTYAIEGVQTGMTEIQPGSYIFMDRQYREIGGSGSDTYDDFEPALSVIATVMSTPTAARVVTDAGLKALSSDVGAPQLLDRPGWTYAFGGDEHGLLVGEGERTAIALGEKVRLLPSRCDTTINLYDRYHVVRGGALAAVWPIAARGRTR